MEFLTSSVGYTRHMNVINSPGQGTHMQSQTKSNLCKAGMFWQSVCVWVKKFPLIHCIVITNISIDFISVGIRDASLYHIENVLHICVYAPTFVSYVCAYCKHYA